MSQGAHANNRLDTLADGLCVPLGQREHPNIRRDDREDAPANADRFSCHRSLSFADARAGSRGRAASSTARC